MNKYQIYLKRKPKCNPLKYSDQYGFIAPIEIEAYSEYNAIELLGDIGRDVEIDHVDKVD